MTDKIQAAKSIRNLANLYRDMASAADALEQIGSLEQAATEAQRATEATRTELESLRAQQAQAATELAEAKAETKKLHEQAQTAVEETAQQATAAASATLAQAEQQADALLARAEQEAADLVAAATEQVRAMQDNLAQLRDAYAKQNADNLAARKELTELEGKLATVRGQLRELLG